MEYIWSTDGAYAIEHTLSTSSAYALSVLQVNGGPTGQKITIGEISIEHTWSTNGAHPQHVPKMLISAPDVLYSSTSGAHIEHIWSTQ